MPPRDPDPFVLLATLSDPAAAELCAALLRSEGIESRLRGESLGPYRLTIGAMAATQVWVPASCIDQALPLIEEADLPDVELAEPSSEAALPWPAARWGLVATALAVVLAALGVWLLLSRLL